MGQYDSNESDGIPRFAIWIGVLVVVNIVLAAVDAPFWIY